MRKIAPILLVAALVPGAALFFWNREATRLRARASMDTAGALLEKGKAAEARVLLEATKPPGEKDPLYEEWAKLGVLTALAERRPETLRAIEEKNPGVVSKVPEARAVLLRDELQRIQSEGGDLNAVEIPDDLPLVAADRELLLGNARKAREILESAKLEGQAELNRLVRLALLDAGDPARAWASLAKAYAIDPRSMEVRTFSGNLLEERGDTLAARREYIAALLSDPSNPRARDNLAEFYVRSGMFPQAVATWLEAPPGPMSSVFQLKAWFWNRVAGGGADFTKINPRSALVDELDALPAGTFWGFSMGSHVEALPAVARRPEIFWLRLLQAVGDRNDPAARALLESATPAQRAPGIRLAALLDAVLQNRIPGAGRVPVEIPESLRGEHPFWNWLAVNSQDAGQLRKDWVLPVLFCVSGWKAAGADLADGKELDGAPDWVRYTLARSAQIAGDNTRFGELLGEAGSGADESAPIRLLKAEAAWQSGRGPEGVAILEELLGEPDAGYRAAFLLGLYHLDRGDAPAARSVLKRNGEFAASVPGKEFEARILLLENRPDAAADVYRELGARSDEARVFLSKRAFEAKDWQAARELTQSLINDHPNEPAFSLNLQKIEEAEHAAEKTAAPRALE